MGGVCAISEALIELQERFNFKFDYYFIHKQSYAAVMLFDAVFDAGMNEAVKWEWYWTPLRFPVVIALSMIADEAALREAWALKLTPSERISEARDRIVALLAALIERSESMVMDDRMREVVRDGLLYAKSNPLAVDFGTNIPKMLSPNAVGFQFVIASIARHQKAASRKVLGIT
jgi:hypothetical protein